MSAPKHPSGFAKDLRSVALATNLKLRKTLLLAGPIAKSQTEQKRRDICRATMERASSILGMLTPEKLEKCKPLELAKVYQILTDLFKPLAADLTPADAELSSLSDEDLAAEVEKADQSN
jgi:hypothetical protein